MSTPVKPITVEELKKDREILVHELARVATNVCIGAPMREMHLADLNLRIDALNRALWYLENPNKGEQK